MTRTPRFVLFYAEEGIYYVWTVKQILAEINRDRSGTFTKYTEADWKEGLREFCDHLTLLGEATF